MTLALITLSSEGACVVARLAEAFPHADCFHHRSLRGSGRPFDRIIALTKDVFESYDGLVYVAPCGVVARAIGPCLRDKRTDPAVVVVDVGARYAISLLSGHEGGANALALNVANCLDAEPVITTTTEAQKTLIVGVGCRRGVNPETIRSAILAALAQVNARVEDVKCIATADVKADEAGLLDAASALDLPLRIIASQTIRACTRPFEVSEFVMDKVNLPAVAEPAALLAGRRTELLLPKTAYRGVTVAIARENCFSLA